MDVRIRPFTSDDYPATNTMNNLLYPDYRLTVEEERYWDKHRDPKMKFKRWIAEYDGKLVGMGEYSQSPDMYHPRKFWIHVMVHPDHQRQGVGSALYNQVIDELQQYTPISLRSEVREDTAPGIRFLQARGFRDVWRRWESRLDLAAFEFAPYQGLEEKLRAQGIDIKTLKELEADPERNRKLHEMDGELAKDIPTLEEMTPFDYNHFVEMFLNNPQLPHEAYFVALHNGEYIGTTSLWRTEADRSLTNNLTGVKRPYRGRGIALALKLRAIAYAREHGYSDIKTWNDSPNKTMISLNERLGFVRQVGWISFLKEFSL